MKKKSSTRKSFVDFRWAHLLWGGLAVCAWMGEQVWQARSGTPFSFLVFLKGFFLLSLAMVIYRASATRGFSFLGMFPLLWLAVSRFQWGLCSDPDYRYWFWLVLFLFAEVLIFTLPDGKKLLMVLFPLWAALTWLFPFSFLLPLTFLTARRGRFKAAEWIRWGGLGIGLGLFIILRGWRLLNLSHSQENEVPVLSWVYFLALWFFFIVVPLALLRKSGIRFVKTAFFPVFFSVTLLGPLVLALAWGALDHIYISGLYDLLIEKRYIGFFLLGWLGMIAFPKNGISRYAVSPLFLLTAGFFGWASFPPRPAETAILSWVLIFFAGFGLESFRKDLMDPTWHGRLVWLALGIAFFAGVV